MNIIFFTCIFVIEQVYQNKLSTKATGPGCAEWNGSVSAGRGLGLRMLREPGGSLSPCHPGSGRAQARGREGGWGKGVLSPGEVNLWGRGSWEAFPCEVRRVSGDGMTWQDGCSDTCCRAKGLGELGTEWGGGAQESEKQHFVIIFALVLLPRPKGQLTYRPPSPCLTAQLSPAPAVAHTQPCSSGFCFG